MLASETRIQAAERIKERTFGVLVDLMKVYDSLEWSRRIYGDEEGILRDLKDLDLIIDGLLIDFPREWMFKYATVPLSTWPRLPSGALPGWVWMENQEDIIDYAEEAFNLVK